MDKPEDIPQDVWDRAEGIAKEATRDAMRDPLMPYHVTVRPYIARAILKAKNDAYDEAARHIMSFVQYQNSDGGISYNPMVDVTVLSKAIRNLKHEG